MNKVFQPNTITIKDPNNLPQNVKFLATIEDTLNYPGRYYSFFQQDSYLSICFYWIVKPNDRPEFLTLEQFDAPLAVLPWFVDKFDFFLKMPHEGGLPHGKIMTDKEQVATESLAICRLMNAGNRRGDGGYQIINFSRQDRDVPGLYQQISFSDSLLFEGGLLALWKSLSDKYLQNGL